MCTRQPVDLLKAYFGHSNVKKNSGKLALAQRMSLKLDPIEEIKLIENELSAIVYYHFLYVQLKKPIRVWTYITQGFYEHDKKELMFTLKCPRDDLSDEEVRAFPEDPLHFFANMYDECKEANEALNEGECRVWDDEKGFIESHFKGLALGPVNNKLYKMSGIELLHDIPTILVHPIYDRELQVCKSFGTVRVLSLLAKQSKQYPSPQYTDIKRESVILQDLECIKKSKAHQDAEQILIHGLTATVHPERRRITWKCPSHIAPLFSTVIDTVPSEKTHLFLLSFAPDAEHHLLWDPDHRNTLDSHCIISKSKVPIKKPNELVGGSFLSFCPCKGSKDYISIQEDGFLALISENTWNTVRHCLSLGIPFTIQSDSELGLDLEVQFLESQMDDVEPLP